jgi:cob(I)alamin adenosyltransferase
MLMVRIDRVVTRGGDTGETSLGNGERIRKDGHRIAAIGTVDEANAAVGVLRLETRGLPEIDTMLARVQNDLFDVGADLCVPGESGERLRVGDAAVKRLEIEVEAMNTALPRLTSFVLPGGSAGAAHAHVARAIVRRAERDTVRLAADEAVNPVVLQYLNRLSDHLFVLARVLNGKGTEEVLWVPGGSSAPPPNSG